MSTGTLSHISSMAELIPGYQVQERIGTGGYGEVWRAEAPGGIAKAIKVIYGRHDDERATRELNALNRIKEVRHPFVLSLERIEQIDGHLVIVTELASSTLKGLFEQHRQSDLPGIPRGELLAHLRDAADALDYLCQEYSLQHLDVKPENLLLVGGRIKVADFGLVKDLQDVHCSNISGLTPLYAAPELFDGRPNDRSDQYSLAIVYQEMLTGSLPFEGRTTAQLAAQHLHSRPRLDRLPASDQATIARALSKDPLQRFSTCRDLIDSLLAATPNRSCAPHVAMGGYCPPTAAVSKTEMLPREAPQENLDTRTPAAAMTQPTEAVPEVRDLPPLDLKAEDAEYRPTVFLGIGGLAGKVLQSLHRRLVERFGDIGAVPGLQMLLLDSDADALRAMTEGDSPAALGNDAAVLLPLRQPADYRSESRNHLQWLSRRWIYNIPRSLQTQGFRPLGRLALVDNIERVADRFRLAIQTAMDPEGLATSARNTGLPFRTAAPRVFIVAAISGGTGSGMALDVGYLVRQVLRDLGLAEEGICGVLAHCGGRNPQTRELGVANAYSLLGELGHYSDSRHGYPGDPTCGLPAFAAEDAPFQHAYLVYLGEDLESKEFAAAANNLADYLYCNAVTPAGAFFDHCREPQTAGSPAASASPTLRTFGLCQVGFSSDDIPASAANELCVSLVRRWRGTDRNESSDRPASLANPTALLVSQFAAGLSDEELRAEVQSRVQSAGLGLAPVLAELHVRALREIGNDPESYLVTVLEELIHSPATRDLAGRRSLAELVLDALDGLIRSRGVQEGGRVCLESLLEKDLKEMAAVQIGALRDWILELVASPGHRVEGAQRAADLVSEHLRAVARQAEESIRHLRQELAPLEAVLRNDPSAGRRWLRSRGVLWRRRRVADRRLSRYFRLRIEDLMLNGVCRVTGLVLAQVTAVDDKLRNLAADLNRLTEVFQTRPQRACGNQGPNCEGSHIVRRLAAETIAAGKAELVAEMECVLEDDLRRVVNMEQDEARRLLPRLLRRTARATVLKALKQAALREIADSSAAERPGERAFSLAAGLQAAAPRLRNCGGERRLLLIAPGESSPEQLVGQLGEQASTKPTVIAGSDDEVFLCYEVEELPLQRVAAAVLDRRFQAVEVASRLHTRIDVPWSPL